MTALDANPVTNDLQLPNRFRFELKRSPNANFWVHRVAIPGFSIDSPHQANPFVNIPKSGEHIDYEQLGVSFFLDAKLASYLEIYTWLRSLGKPQSFDEYAALLVPPPILDEGVTSEISVYLLNGQNQPTFQFVFHDAFPTAIGGWEMVADDEGLQRIAVNTAFKYSYFDILPVK